MAKRRKIKVTPWFRDSFRGFAANDPRVKANLTTFNHCKRKFPPDPLPAGFKDHALKGKLSDYRECHLAPNVTMLWCFDDDALCFLEVCDHDDLEGRKAEALARKIKRFLN